MSNGDKLTKEKIPCMAPHHHCTDLYVRLWGRDPNNLRKLQ